MLNELLLNNISEDNIIVKKTEVPEIWYEDNGIKRRYYVDCFIKSQNKCIEIKSTWTLTKKKDIILLKQQAVKDAGYECEIWVYDKTGTKIEILP